MTMSLSTSHKPTWNFFFLQKYAIKYLVFVHPLIYRTCREISEESWLAWPISNGVINYAVIEGEERRK